MLNEREGQACPAMLAMIGLQELIVSDPEQYVKLAIDLGRDAARRRQLSERIVANRHRLYDDTAPTKVLSEFFIRMTRGDDLPAADPA